jgi:photosystem II stability/assembly factor-like uncharacterized protein
MSKWKLWVSVIIGWVLVAGVVVFVRVGIPALQRRALVNDPGVPAGMAWTAAGPIWSGDITAATCAPDGQLYVGTGSGALYRSINGGDTWNLLGRTTSGSAVTAVTATSGPMTVLFRAVDRQGLEVSYDDGRSWQHSGRGFGDYTITALTQSGDGAGMYLATASHGIYATRDLGRHWQQATAGLPTLNISCLVATPPDDGRLFAGSYDGGVFTANMGDLAWRDISAGLPGGAPVTAITWNTARPDTVVVVVKHTEVYMSTDGGTRWAAAAGLPDEAGSITALSIAAQPEWQLVAATSTGDVYTCSEPAKGWHSVSPDVRGLTIHVLCQGPQGTLIAGTSGGVLLADPTVWQWVEASSGIEEADVTCLSPDPTEPRILYAGTTGGLFRSPDAGATWERVAGELASQDIAVVTRTGPSLLVGTRRAGLWIRTGTGPWRRLAPHELSDDVLSLLPVASSSDTLLAGTSFGVWEVNSATGIATERNLGLRPKRSPTSGQNYAEVTALVRSPANPGNLLAIVRGTGLFESTNAGLVWTQVAIVDKPMLGNAPDLSWLSSVCFVADGTVYVGSLARGIWMRPSGTRSWSAVNNGLSRIGVPCGTIGTLAVDTAGRLYAATSGSGMRVLMPRASTWLRLNKGLPSLGAQTLALSSDGRTLYCAVDSRLYLAGSS